MSDPATPPPVAPHLSPKERFLSRADESEVWRKLVRSDTFLNGITHAFAEYCLNNNPNSDQVEAVRGFIETTLNLAEPKSQRRSGFPDKRLIPPPLPPSQVRSEE